MIEQVKSLFKGNRELILGFNTFLPKVSFAHSNSRAAHALNVTERGPFSWSLARHPALPDVWLRIAFHCLLLQGFEIQMPLEEEEQVREAWNKLAQLQLLLVAARGMA